MVLLRRELGEVLKEHREARGLTLRDLAATSAVSHGYLSEIERGKKEASSELLASICSALDVPMSGLFGELAQRFTALETMSAPVQLPLPAADEGVSASAA